MSTLNRTIENGIERITVTPTERRFRTPILMQHGMWHGARTWEGWQHLFAEWGWETHAISLPGHGESPVQRPIRWCTLDYYLRFLANQAQRLTDESGGNPPVLMGHSMGGALVQWYLKHIGDDLPAAVLVAPWRRALMIDTVLNHLRLDFVGAILSSLTLTATPNMRNPQVAARALLNPDSPVSPEALFAYLGPESLLVLLQHNPPFWTPPKQVRTPLLWISAGQDAFRPLRDPRGDAQAYGATYLSVSGAGHNLMMERSAEQTACAIHEWLVKQSVG